MALDAAVLEAYRKAEYVVFGEPPLVLRIGEPSRRLDAMLEAARRETAAFVTACTRAASCTATRITRRRRCASSAPWRRSRTAATPGKAAIRKGAGPPMLVVGISRAEAEALGRAFEQNAVVFIERGGAAQVLVLR